MAPDVTVVVGVYNAMPYFLQCLDSVDKQTIGPKRLELVVVDDGSTDSSGDEAEKFAARSEIPVRVVRQQNSGGPSKPRNVGMEMARGRYIFFLDADDYLGEEALERMVAVADRASTDVVLGRIIGMNRKAPESMFATDVDRTDMFSCNILNTMSAEKLFRRSMLERYGIRFNEVVHNGEDTCFTLEAYVRAAGISIVAGYPCLYILGRDDGQNLTSIGSTEGGFIAARAQLSLVVSLLPPGDQQDQLLVRPFRLKVLKKFGPRLRKEPKEVWDECMDLAVPLVDEFMTPGVWSRLRPDERLRMHFLAERRTDLLKDVLRVMAAR